ncbi:MAG: hypothetical protein EP334_08260 [Gammaproteobacteria bacterium]|nr:MAG: hypothetical protein EP334_08260 [Gammaproteobacteria bacterium]
MKNTRTIYKPRGAMAVLLCCLVAMVAEAGNLYRYRNSEGNFVIDYQVPPEYIAKGYEVITNTGRVEKVVPPRLASDEVVQAIPEETLAQQREEDKMLLRSYSTLEELRAAGERRLEQLNREIEIVESNLTKNAKQLREFHEQAAMRQFNGEQVPASLLKGIEDVETVQRDAEQVLALRRAEYRQVEYRYQLYAERFVELTAKRPSE